MINPKTELETPSMKKVQDIIIKSIKEKHELKILDDVESDSESYIINEEKFWDYANSINDLLSYSEAVLSCNVGNFYRHFEKCDFTKEDFFNYLTLVGQVWKVLDENVVDKEYSREAKFHLEDYFDDIMTGIRRKIYELNFDKTEVWKELEKRIDKDILKPKFPEKINEIDKIEFSKKYREIFGEEAPNPSIVKNLLLVSGNRCAYPKCKNELIESDGYLKGEICCIEYNVKRYPRFNPDLTKQEMIDSNNLIFLCDVHHLEIELHEDKFPPEVIRGWTLNHKSKNNENTIVENVIIENFIRKFQNYSPIETLGIHHKPKNKWSGLQELISTFGITICSKCRTRTKMIKTERGPQEGWFGYTVCPKCGYRERWESEFSFPSAG